MRTNRLVNKSEFRFVMDWKIFELKYKYVIAGFFMQLNFLLYTRTKITVCFAASDCKS